MAIFPKEAIQKRQKNVAEALSDVLKNDECLLVLSGLPIGKPGGLDQTYDFLPHPTYYWLTGFRSPRGVAFFSKSTGWIDFVKFATREDKFWEGADEELHGRDISELESFLSGQKFSQIYKIGQLAYNDSALTSDAGKATLEKIHLKVNALRRVKDAHEIQMILDIADIANKGYKKLQSFIRPGVTEKDIQIEFESEIQRHGAHGMPYGTIVGSGSNAAILHAIPTIKKVEQSDLVLIDAGADVYDYCVDITRVYPASGQFSTMQKEIYDLVKQAQIKAIEKCQIGTQWHDVHRTSAKVIAEGLKALNIMKGDTEAILDTGAIAVFYPHGVGHLVGLRVRDVGCPENLNPKKYCGANLRVDLELKENFLITVEPGCYFIKGLIDDAENRTKFKDFINWQEAEKWKGLGGVRIEDDMLITQGPAKNLTAVVDKI